MTLSRQQRHKSRHRKPLAKAYLPQVVADHLPHLSLSEVRRLMAIGAVRLDGEAVQAAYVTRERLSGAELTVGRKITIRLPELTS